MNWEWCVGGGGGGGVGGGGVICTLSVLVAVALPLPHPRLILFAGGLVKSVVIVPCRVALVIDKMSIIN